jgi:transposase-like protein
VSTKRNRGHIESNTSGEGARVQGTRKRHRTVEERRKIVEETLLQGASVSRVARRHDVNANQVFHWRKLYQEGRLGSSTTTGLLTVKVADAYLQLWPPLPISPSQRGLDCESAPLLDALDSRLGEPSTHIVCTAMTVTPHFAELWALAAVPKVLARQCGGTIRCHRFAQYPLPSSVYENDGRSETPATCERAI